MEFDDILNLDRLQCTGEQARAGWYLDQDAILEAIDELGIKLQVRVRYMTGIYRNGSHYSRGSHHKITLDQNREAAQSSNTLWHELAHCMQAENWANHTGRDIRYWHWEDYKQVDGEHGRRYKGNKYEIEANRIADEHKDFMLVVFAT